ncbi:MAG: hypothetical protein O7E52_19930, partial [Candidatus Poribacteria bacterium]|nr:hypothetical protein [Candidatus Poribacteria bacterium]
MNDTDVFDFSTFPTLTTERLVLREPLLTDATDVLIDNKGEGVSLCFFCDDALKFYRDVRSRGIDASEPHVGNGMWATQVTDPDGYELAFQ